MVNTEMQCLIKSSYPTSSVNFTRTNDTIPIASNGQISLNWYEHRNASEFFLHSSGPD